MSDGLAARMRALVDEARAAGRLEELRALIAEAPAATEERDPDEVPSRFGMVGASAALQEVCDLVERVARSDVPVLVTGETGTGKELVARALHDLSPRAKKPFLAENCAAISPSLLESELFGHTRGSFTGAVGDRPGHFKAADGGTVFLDEIGDMPLEMQAKLLRVLEQGEVRPVGANKVVKVDVRVVAATNRDLAQRVEAGEFRADLLYRLDVVHIHLPPLRERAGDVRHLVRFFHRKLSEEMGLPAGPLEERFSEAALEELERRPWRGNVRELENEVRRSLALVPGRIEPEDLTPTHA